MSRMAIDGHCPACGRRSLGVKPSLLRGPTARIECFHPGCPAPGTAATILDDPEIHHIVRFDGASGTFNAQHPLRERVGGLLLDCDIHDEVRRWYADEQGHAFGDTPDGTYRLKRNDESWLWEKL
jgi:hypothetical protein